jgi:hypothetical protein
LNEIIQQNKQLLEEKKKNELFLSAASPSNLEPKKSIKGAGKTILGDPGANKHHFDELKGPHQEEIQKQKEFISENASARAEAMAFVWFPLACIGS